MSSVKVQDYCTTQAVMVTMFHGEKKELPAGAFVKPIEYKWVPKHILDCDMGRWFNKDIQTFCYTHYGIVVIPNEMIRKAGP